MKSKYDIRVLCRRCCLEMSNCGYELVRTKEKNKEECWKCRKKRGYEYRIR